MYACAFTCIHEHIYVYMCIYIYLRVYRYIRTNLYGCVYMIVYMCLAHIFTYKSVCVYVYIYVYSCIRTYINMSTCIHMHICIHTYIHIRIYVCMYVSVCIYRQIGICICVYIYIYAKVRACMCVRAPRTHWFGKEAPNIYEWTVSELWWWVNHVTRMNESCHTGLKRSCLTKTALFITIPHRQLYIQEINVWARTHIYI